MMPPLHRLSKSRFTSGLQCHKKLWWQVHDPDAIELQPDKVLQDLFDQGRQVGEVARTRYPGGVLIDLPHRDVPARVEAARQVLRRRLPPRDGEKLRSGYVNRADAVVALKVSA